MIKEEKKFSDSCVFEGMSSISAIIKAFENKKSDRKIITVLVDKNKTVSKKRELSFLRVKSKALGFNIEVVEPEIIDQMTTGMSHGGIIAQCSERTFSELQPSLIKPDGVYFMFEGIEDPYNFGYSVRSLYASGCDGIILSPRNWMSAAGVVARSSAGTSELIDMFVAEPLEAADIFSSMGYKIVCAGIRDSVSLFSADLSKPLLVVMGGEKRGISRAMLDKADQIVRIDYGRDFNGSLSTAASTAIFAFEILKNNIES